MDDYIADQALARHSRQLTVPQEGRRTPASDQITYTADFPWPARCSSPGPAAGRPARRAGTSGPRSPAWLCRTRSAPPAPHSLCGTEPRPRPHRPLDNPDGEILYRRQYAQAEKKDKRQRAAEREAERPVCERCGAEFTDQRWEETTMDRLVPKAGDLSVCGTCHGDDVARREAAAEAERVARREAEEAAARAAAEAGRKKSRGLFGRHR